MKILEVCPKYYPEIGGIEEHVRNIAEKLSKKYEVSVATTDASGKLPKQEVIKGVEVMRFKSWAPGEAYFFSCGLYRYLLKHSYNFDIIHAHGYAAFPALSTALTKRNNKLVFTPHYHKASHTFFRSLLHKPYKLIGKKIFEKADSIVCVSNYEKNLIKRCFLVDEGKIIVIPNGVNLDEFKWLKKRSKDYKVILCVGRLEKYKGMQYLVKVLKKLDKDIILEIVGKGPYKDSLTKLVKKVDVEGRVRFFQDLPRNRLLQKYTDADVFVLLSEYEAYGITIAESLCARTPCIVANTSALTEWIDGENCFGVQYPINLDELRSVIDSVMGKTVKILKIPDWKEVAEKISNIYKSLINQ